MTDARIITGDARVRSPAIRYHGAKFRLASWLLQYFPPHDCYVEPYGGAAGVLVRKPRAYAEVYNDLDGDIVNFFRVLRDPETRATRRAGSSPARGTSEHWRGFRAGSPPSGKRNGEMICPHDAPGAGHEIVRNSA